MALSRTEREKFLAEPHIAALSVVEDPQRGPLTVPVWYQYTPGEDAWVLTSADSRKARAIESAGRFSLMAERLTPTVRYVSVEGPVVDTIDGTDAHMWEIARRYLPEEAAAAYVKVAKADHGPQVVILLRPQRWLSADLGAGA